MFRRPTVGESTRLRLRARGALFQQTVAGNISNLSLETLLRKNLAEVIIALEKSSFVELGRDFLTSHGD